MKTKIVTLVKNEHEYMKEWLDYHLGLGFDRIDVYEDFGSLSHGDITNGYADVSLRRITDMLPDARFEPNANRYGLLLEKTMYEDRDEFDWTLCIDVDEYLVFGEGRSLTPFLLEYSAFPGIYLYWKFMSANGHIRKCRNIVMSYTSESTFGRYYINQFKCFFNLKLGLMCQGHCQHRARYGVDTDKKFVRFSKDERRPFDKAWINHYFTKSWEDWLERIYEKGNLTHGIRRLADFFEYNEDMLPMKDRLMQKEFGRRPRCSIWLDAEESLLFTGRSVHAEDAERLNRITLSEGLQAAQDYVERNFPRRI